MRQLPPGWIMSTVGQVGEVSLGRQRAPKYHHGEGMRPYLRVANVFEDRIDTTDVMQMTFSDDEFERYRLQPGDVLLNEGQSPHLLGRPAIYRGHPPDVAFTNSLIRFRARPGVTPEWALAVFRHCMHSRRFMRESRITTNIAHLSATRFSTVEFPVPPVAEQRRIVAAIEEQFSRLDAGVAALERARQNIKRMRAAIFEAAVTEWIGEGFPKIRLGDVLREPLRNGHSAKADPLGTIPVLTLTAVTLGDFGAHNVKMTAADPRRVRNLWIQPGDLLIERSNTRELVGTACLYRGRPNLAVYPDLVIRARVDDRVAPEYAELVLKAPRSRRYFQQRAQGISGTMPKIDQGTIEDLAFTLPSPEMQAAVVQEAERRLTLLGSLQKDLELVAKRSSALCSSILRAAFSGKLVPQDPADESASALLERIATERASSNGRSPGRTRKLRIPKEKAVV